MGAGRRGWLCLSVPSLTEKASISPPSATGGVLKTQHRHNQCLGVLEDPLSSFLPPPHQVLDHLDEHLHKSEYFRFLWFPHSDHVSVIYQDHTQKVQSPRCQAEGRGNGMGPRRARQELSWAGFKAPICTLTLEVERSSFQPSSILSCKHRGPCSNRCMMRE